MKHLKKILLVLALCAMAAMTFVGCSEKGPETITLDDGSVYVGEVVDGVPNGEGTLTDLMGSVWTGTFVDGKLNGYGTYLGYDLVEYEGFFKDGLFEGYGHWIGSNGDEYSGMFSGGKQNGVGRMDYTTECDYEGGWVDGYMDGFGWMTWPVGDIYFGEWSAGNPNGFGLKLFYDASISTQGNYRTYNQYMGYMVNNLPEGWGIMHFAGPGDLYVGNWVSGARDGQGICYFGEDSEAGCIKFVGTFDKDYSGGWINGEGTMYYEDGTVVHGIFEGTECVEVLSTSQADPGAVSQEAAAALQEIQGSALFEQLEQIGR